MTDPQDPQDPPTGVVEEVVRLTRLAREAVDEGEATAYRREREQLLVEYSYTARVREEDRAVLVCYPAEWVEEGTVHPDRIDDLDRGIERPLEGPGTGDDWAAVDEHNRDLAAAVAAEHGDTHGETARALAAFASNHYAKRIEALTADELAEFREEFFPRNAWPSDEQRSRLSRSVRFVYEAAGVEPP